MASAINSSRLTKTISSFFEEKEEKTNYKEIIISSQTVIPITANATGIIDYFKKGGILDKFYFNSYAKDPGYICGLVSPIATIMHSISHTLAYCTYEQHYYYFIDKSKELIPDENLPKAIEVLTQRITEFEENALKPELDDIIKQGNQMFATIIKTSRFYEKYVLEK